MICKFNTCGTCFNCYSKHFNKDCFPCEDADPMTNADRIRSMTDEELAELLADETYRIAKPCFDAFDLGLEKQAIYVKRLDWLQQPSE